MAVTAKHKKARIFRDFLISSESVNMFKEEELEQAILFRSVYPIKPDVNKQFMIIIDDTIYVTMQALIIEEVPVEKRQVVLDYINQIHLNYPSVKYVLTPDNQIMTSMMFHAHENNMDPTMIMMCILEFFKVVGSTHYDELQKVIA
ncbi:MAG: hypothetical protein AB9856_12525 [Cellulosilyticaceae bacterium]